MPNRPDLWFDDFEVGAVTPYGRCTVDREAMLAFAREFDPQDFHLDEEAAKSSFSGGLIASGWYVCCLNMRMMCDDFILRSASMGSPGIEQLKWLKPVKAGDRLTATRRVLAKQASRSKPDRGVVHLDYAIANQDGETVLAMDNWIMFARRPDAPPLAPSVEAAPALKAAPSTGLPLGDRIDRLLTLDRLTPGMWIDLGAVTFTEADIVRFALAFDNQYFHIDPVAARNSQFGGLIASGWHTASVWMGQNARARRALHAESLARGETPAAIGPSPGFRNLRWLRPVRPGDVLTYRSQIVEARPSASRPGWGIITHFNTADDSEGRRVFEFTGSVFWEHRRP